MNQFSSVLASDHFAVRMMSKIKCQSLMKVFVLVIFIGISMGLDAQTRLIGERSVYTQYFLSPFLLNPGATGQKDYGQVMAYYRNAWSSFSGSPKTVTIAYDGAIGNRVGLGVIGMSDSFAALNTSKGALSLSYSISTPDHKIGVGLSGEYVQHRLNGAELVNNPFVNSMDPEILNGLDGISFFDASVGVYGMYQNKLIYGVSFPSIVSQKVSGPVGDQATTNFGFIANLGYRIEIEDKDLVFEPSIWAKQLMLVPFHVDVNLKADFLGEQLSTAITYSYGAEERLGFMVGTQVNNFGFHYSYNLSMHDFQQYNNGSHELSLRLRLQAYVKSSGE